MLEVNTKNMYSSIIGLKKTKYQIRLLARQQMNEVPSILHYRHKIWNVYAALICFAVLLLHASTVETRSPAAKLRALSKSTIIAAAAAGSAGVPELTVAAPLIAAPHKQAIEKFSIEGNSIQRSRNIETKYEAAGEQLIDNRSLKRVYLSNRTVTCNDGSQAGFYLRKNPNSKKWIVFLEGGWHCFDTRSCRARWLRLRHLMTSAQWPETRDVGGILSPLSDENPYWHNANHVLVPYCSSDSWSGTRATTTTDNISAEAPNNNWRFMGALILRQVIADLIPLGLGRVAGAELLLVGSSAGGLGVMLNLDGITKFLQQERNLMVMVRGVSDSGWFLDREPYTPSAVASKVAVRQGWKLWHGLLPEDCSAKYAAEPWRCYFGYHLYPTLKSPLFVFQWLFDEAQMRADNVGAPVTPQQWNYIHEMGAALRTSLDNVTAVFAPSCIGHAVLTKRDWVHIKIDDISLPQSLRCWEHETRIRRKRQDKIARSTDYGEILDEGHSTDTEMIRRQRHKNKHNKNNNNNGPRHTKRQNVHKRQQQQHNKNNNTNDEIDQQQQQRVDEKEEEAAVVRQRKNKRKQNLTLEERAVQKKRRIEAQEYRREQRRQQRKKNALENMHNGTDWRGNRKRNKQQRKHRNNKNNNNFKHNNVGGGNVDSAVNKPKNRSRSRQRNKQLKKLQFQHEHHIQDGTLHLQNDPNLATTDITLESQIMPYSHGGASPLYSFSSMAHFHHGSSGGGGRKKTTHGRANSHMRVPRVPERCASRLLERCSWPQCNYSCPALTNPLTGEEMRFLELLASFGLDIEAVATALGVDMHTLNNMDRTELVNMLTQQVS